jgi:beta-glucanase (GH16 family)
MQPGQDAYPGIGIKPEGAAWNLSAYGHIEAKVVNLGAQPLTLAMRVDNAGDWHDNPWNTETVTLAPGAHGVIDTMFGYSYGHKPGFALKPEAVVNLLLFAGKSDAVQSFRLESLVAAGVPGEKPPVAPDDVRIEPPHGILLGHGMRLPASQVATQGVQASVTGESIQMTLTSAEGTLLFRPAAGRWDLRHSLEVRVTLRNAGKQALTPAVRLDSNGGSSEWFEAKEPVASGAETTITAPFAGSTPKDMGVNGGQGSGSNVTSDSISGIVIRGRGAEGSVLRIEAITANTPPAVLPDWLGKRPPVAGDWTQTLDDEFNGASLNTSVWNVTGENYYDKVSHWSKDDVLVGNGVVRLRYEKKTGFHNDDPSRPKSPYSAGYLDTYGKWTQRYGYFEARMKLPTAPGLWPAFWMMPDRGAANGDQGKRQATTDGGMEFDIMEHLTRWGPYRYNIAMHYDGYEKDHKALGSDRIYMQPDKDGYITCGLLWTPGSAKFYCNGREVLQWENPRISSVASDLMFTIPSGGWDNNALDDARLPADWIVDYVRVWQRKDLAGANPGQ